MLTSSASAIATTWVQLGNGLIKAIRLKSDLSETVGDPITLLDAGDFSWTRKQIGYKGGLWPGAVTDGPELFRLSNGTLAMLWSNHTPDHQYAQAIAYSPSGKLVGPWQHEPQPVLWDDRGHGMLFRVLPRQGGHDLLSEGKLLLVLHHYFQMPRTRVQIFEVEDLGDRVRVGKQIVGAP
jgi:arabinan endo-1,5-alpha-L-arabinosidase